MASPLAIQTHLTCRFHLAVVVGVSFGGVMTSFLLTIRSLVPMRIAATSLSLGVLFGWVGKDFGA